MSTVVAGPIVTKRCEEQIRKGELYPHRCLQRTRLALGIPAKYQSAIAAFRAVPPAHRHPGYAPEGFPMFYDCSQWGHVTNSRGDKRNIFSNVGIGIVKLVSYKAFPRPLGWTDQLNGVNIVSPTPTPTPGAPQHAAPTPPAPVTKPPAWHKAPYPGKVLKIGSRGDAVKELQFHLALKVTGKYDARTAAAVDGFVKARNRKYPRGTRGYLGVADGTAGPKTYRAITGHA